MERLHVLVDSFDLNTVAATLVKLASEYDLTIRLNGTLEEVTARALQIEQLLLTALAARQAKESIKFIFGIGGDLTKLAADSDGYAFKLHDFGRRGL